MSPGWLLWLFGCPYLFVLDGVVARHLPVRVDFAAAVCLVFALHARPAALPGLLLCAALGRSLLVDGDVAVHFLALGFPVAVLLPLRTLLFGFSPLWQGAVAVLLAWAVPAVGGALGRLAGQAVATSGGGVLDLLGAAVGVPTLAWLLRSLPPLSLFVEEPR